MAEHTPAPWGMSDGRHIHCGDRWVASIMGIAGEEGEANARLIAAAPDLLAAAKKIRAELDRWIDHYVNANEPVPVFAGIVDLATAIAKATGA